MTLGLARACPCGNCHRCFWDYAVKYFWPLMGEGWTRSTSRGGPFLWEWHLHNPGFRLDEMTVLEQGEIVALFDLNENQAAVWMAAA